MPHVEPPKTEPKKFALQIATGYVISFIIILLLALISFIYNFFGSFYSRLFFLDNTFFGFLISFAAALLLGHLAYTPRSWKLMSAWLVKYSWGKHIINSVDQWRDFLELGLRHGFLFIPYFHPGLRALGVVTGAIREESGKYGITVAFFNLPFPQPFVAEETTEVLATFTFTEAIAFAASLGFAFRKFNRRLVRLTLREYVEKNLSHILHEQA